MTRAIQIDVWSDIACPWCYIGKRNLEAGLRAYGGTTSPRGLNLPTPPADIVFHSFQLAPDTPVDFEGTTVEYLSRRKGIPANQAREMLERVTAVARSVGLHYDFDAVQHTNTGKAHELLHYARAHGRQADANERLLRAYFVEGRHLGRDFELADLAAEVGLDRDDVLRSLRAGEHRAAVRADQQLARQYGISGVPFFVIDGRYGISGAQPADFFTQALVQAAADRDDDAVA